MKKLLLQVLILFPFCSYSQFYQTGFHSEIPPLPESAVFRQFAGYIPSLNTGAANVPIPLYDIKAGGFTLPVSLQYYTSGIKVEAVADPVGYGWSLNPGLRITRTIRGRADDGVFSKVIFPSAYSGDSYYRFFYAKRAMMEEITRTPEDIEFDQIFGTNTLIDTKYDIFTIHLPDGNHSFIYKGAGNIESLNPLLKIREIMSGYRISGFEVTDDKGISYYFGCYAGENLGVTPPYLEHPTYSKGYYTAWGLRRITMPDGKTQINITWGKADTKAYFTLPYQTKIGYLDNRPRNVANGDPEGGERPPRLTTAGNFYEPLHETVLRIQEIEFPLGRMTFAYTNRNDKSILSSIVVKNDANDVIKNIGFEYDTSSTLLLSKLSISGEGIYKFSYNPKRFENFFGQDFWGYYNGKHNNNVLLPNFKVGVLFPTGGTPVTEEIYQFGYADRSIDREFMQANILTKVDYPTGGYTEFEYEPHAFQEVASRIVLQVNPLTEGRGLRVTKITTKPDAASLPVVKTYKYYDPRIYDNISTYDSFIDRYQRTYQSPVNEVPPGQNPSILNLCARNTDIYAHSCLSHLYVSTPPIFYMSVEEYVNDTHKTACEFANFTEDIVSIDPRPAVHSYRNIDGDSRPLIKKTSYKKENSGYTPVEEINYTYLYVIYHHYPETHLDFKVFNTIDSEEGHFRFYNPVLSPAFSYDPYYIFDTSVSLRDSRLSAKERITYIGDSQIKEKTYYDYTTDRLLAQKKFISSQNVEVKENYSYLGATSYPTTTTRTVNGLTETRKIQYYPGNKYQVENISLYKDLPSPPRVTYHNYNSYGKPVYITLDDATKIVYLWSYKGQYPVAEIRNATYPQVSGALTQALIDRVAGAGEPSAGDMAAIDHLRANIALNAHVATYTYRPLVGMLTTTDPKGVTTHYDYDSSGKLKYIRDNDRQLLNWYQYNYHDGSGREDEDQIYQPIRLKLNYTAGAYSLNWGTQYFETFKAIKAGGSGSDRYSWTIKDSGNNTLAVHDGGTDPEYRVDLCRWGGGQMTLTCTVEDQITHETANVSQPLNIYMSPLIFEDIQWPDRYAASGMVVTANLISDSRKTVRFVHESKIGNVVYIFRDPYQGTRTLHFDNADESRDIVIEPGITNVEMWIENGNPYSSNQVKLKISGSDHPLTHIGSPYKWIGDYIVYPNPY